ncbi:MAG: DUF3822 family protein [Bacteroidota bacterium]|nr:DUF3822 family protein [Bacteroidota bacterium]
MEQPIESTTINQYLLTIRIGSDGYNLSVFDESSILLSSKKVAASLFSISSDEIIKLLTPETQLNYRTLRLICESEIYTFVPALFFKPENATDFLQFLSKPIKSNQVLFNRIPQWDTVNVFSIPKTVHTALTHLFPDVPVEHHLGYFLGERVKLQSENSVSIAVRSNVMDVIVISGGGLQLINSYSFNTPEDFTYYTLNLFDKLQLDTENCNVVLYNAGKRPELQKTLELYLGVTTAEY